MLQSFDCHPLDRQGAVLVLHFVVIVVVDVSRQAKVCDLHRQLLVDPEIHCRGHALVRAPGLLQTYAGRSK